MTANTVMTSHDTTAQERAVPPSRPFWTRRWVGVNATVLVAVLCGAAAMLTGRAEGGPALARRDVASIASSSGGSSTGAASTGASRGGPSGRLGADVAVSRPAEPEGRSASIADSPVTIRAGMTRYPGILGGAATATTTAAAAAAPAATAMPSATSPGASSTPRVSPYPGVPLQAMPSLIPSPPVPPPIPDVAALPPLDVGDTGPAVTLLKQRLVGLGFRPGSSSDRYDWTTWQAVLAFQKFDDIERTGAVDAETWSHLSRPQGWRSPIFGKTLRVEVDIDRQVMFVINAEGPSTIAILNVSTGGNYEYLNPETKQTELAVTPTGTYAVYRRVDGSDVGPLGELYRPQYFVGGYAIHGSPSVPEYPASHGCVRVSNTDADWLWDRVSYQVPVALYDRISPASYEERWYAERAGIDYHDGETSLELL